MKINFNIKLTKKQQEAYDLMHQRDCKFLVARWSRQCGKTVFSVDGITKKNVRAITDKFTKGGEYKKLVGTSGAIWGAALRSTDDSKIPMIKL